MKRMSLIASLVAAGGLLAPAAAQAPSRFEGRLVGQDTGAPVAGASVSIPGTTGSGRARARQLSRRPLAPGPSCIPNPPLERSPS